MQHYLDALALIIEDPASNLTAAVLLLAAVFLLLLILIVLVLVLIDPSQDASADRRTSKTSSPLSARQQRRRGFVHRALNSLNARWTAIPRTIRITAPVLLVVLASLCTYTATGTDRFCADNCHQMSEVSKSWASSAHGQVRCVRCHEGQPITSASVAAVARSMYVIGSLTGATPSEVSLPADRCIQCHSCVLKGNVESATGIRMDHSAPVRTGVACSECHLDAGHTLDRPSRPSRMRICQRCHDDHTAPSTCETCHIGDVGNHAVLRRQYRKTALPQPTCGGCHDETSCDACHGLRMPHSQEFIEGEHAPLAAFERKESCWRCHRESDCGQCHGQFQSGHGDAAAFKQQHKSYSWDLACNGCHPNHEGAFCKRCH